MDMGLASRIELHLHGRFADKGVYNNDCVSGKTEWYWEELEYEIKDFISTIAGKSEWVNVSTIGDNPQGTLGGFTNSHGEAFSICRENDIITISGDDIGNCIMNFNYFDILLEEISKSGVDFEKSFVNISSVKVITALVQNDWIPFIASDEEVTQILRILRKAGFSMFCNMYTPLSTLALMLLYR